MTSASQPPEPPDSPTPPGSDPVSGPPIGRDGSAGQRSSRTARSSSHDSPEVRARDARLLDATFGPRDPARPARRRPRGSYLEHLRRQSDAGSLGTGFTFLFFAHMAAGVVVSIADFVNGRVSESGAPGGQILSCWAFFLGVAQLPYAIPLGIVLTRRRQYESAKGVWLGIVVTFLLNAACFGIVMDGLRFG